MNTQTCRAALAVLTALSVFALAPLSAQSQTAVDAFAPNPDHFVRAVAVQPDGKILLGGNFDQLGGAPRSFIGRVHPDSSLDATFLPDIEGDHLRTITLQPDGKIVVGGDFTEINDSPCPRIGRLNEDGTRDTAFTQPTGADDVVRTVALQADGKILVGGHFQNLGGQPRAYIGRLNTNGTLDTSFNPGADNIVRTIVMQPNGRILVGGFFTNMAGTVCNFLTRLDPDGTQDGTFNTGLGADGPVRAIALQPDGKILIGGDFTNFNGVAINRIARLNADGSLDTTFDPGIGANNDVYSIVLQSDGKIVVGGIFTKLIETRRYIARLNTDGTLDAAFYPTGGANNSVFDLAVQPNGNIIVGGAFTQMGGIAHQYAVRLLPATGQPDSTFYPADGANGVVYTIVPQADGKVIAGGSFTTIGGAARNRIARLQPSTGAVDPDFDPDANGIVYSVAIEADGNILVGGTFTDIGPVTVNRLARIRADGSLDGSFLPGADAIVYNIAIQDDGKIVIGGSFQNVAGQERKYIARLNSNGSLDTGFVPAELNGIVFGLAIQADGKIVISGGFSNVGAASHKRIARLNTDGSLDTGFDPGDGANNTVYTLKLLRDGRILAGGLFTSMGEETRWHLACLNTDGSVCSDYNFVFNNLLYSLALQEDGKVIVGGAFTEIGDEARKRLARLNADGTLDATFDLPDGANIDVASLALQADGKLLVGGYFTELGGQNRNFIGRIAMPETASQTLSASQNGNSITWLRGGVSPALEQVSFQQSTNGTDWTALGGGTSITNGWQLANVSLPVNRNIYIRALGVARGGVCNGSGSLIESTRLCYVPARIDGDYDGDLKSDLALYRDGYWSIFSLVNGVILVNAGIWGDAGCIPVRGDFDGDTLADLTVLRNGYWSTFSLARGIILLNHDMGGANCVAVPGDYDGDGADDLAAFRDGYWSIYSLVNGVILDDVGVWGDAGCVPVPGDYDGDGLADLTLYRDGYWSIFSLVNGALLINAGTWGGPGFIPVAGDFDGDGRSDLAVYRDGYWSIFSLTRGVLLAGYELGAPGCMPAPGDYDGDGADDLAVCDQDGYWSIYSLANGIILDDVGVWGGAGWVPVR